LRYEKLDNVLMNSEELLPCGRSLLAEKISELRSLNLMQAWFQTTILTLVAKLHLQKIDPTPFRRQRVPTPARYIARLPRRSLSPSRA
jgi:hypothetical protein